MNANHEPTPPAPAPETGAAGPQAELPPPDARRLEAERDAARAEAATNLDRFLRAKAETENVRRRAEQESANARKYAVERFAADVINVRDSLEHARAVPVPAEPTVRQLHEGLDATLKLFDEIFRRFAITPVDPQGEKFDPEKHEAISVVTSAEVAPNHVVAVMRKGYLLQDRVLRPAMVVVSAASGGSPPDPAANA